MSEDWQPIETLVRDGRQVRMRCPAGEFVAPASPEIAPESLRRIRHEIYNAGGGWPNAKWTATHWAELDAVRVARQATGEE